MPKIAYEPRSFQAKTLEVINRANRICESYAAQGFTLTLRQLYYQFVSRGWIPNRDTEYKRLGSIINDARHAGLIDWRHMEDRTRNLKALPHWDSPADIIDTCARQFQEDLWGNQEAHVEVWIEKDALVGVIEPACVRNDVAYFSCRGYTSASEVWAASQRLLSMYRAGRSRLVVLHLGDHDPSGIDMTRDVGSRIRDFLHYHSSGAARALDIQRLALNMPQVEEYSPPPNPGKITDSRFAAYQERYGDDSWELDALEPTVIDGLIQRAIDQERDADLWAESLANRNRQRRVLRAISSSWAEVESQYGGEDSEDGDDGDTEPEE